MRQNQLAALVGAALPRMRRALILAGAGLLILGLLFGARWLHQEFGQQAKLQVTHSLRHVCQQNVEMC